jgi:hypothetical protein
MGFPFDSRKSRYQSGREDAVPLRHEEIRVFGFRIAFETVLGDIHRPYNPEPEPTLV